jgi:hypothetical protein
MIVEMDIFSGRPNPTWKLTPEQTQELQLKVSDLRRQIVPPRVFDGLGYRGLIVRDSDDPASFLKVGFGVIFHTHGGTEIAYEDEGHAFEKWLLTTGKGKIDDRLLAVPLDAPAR